MLRNDPGSVLLSESFRDDPVSVLGAQGIGGMLETVDPPARCYLVILRKFDEIPRTVGVVRLG